MKKRYLLPLVLLLSLPLVAQVGATSAKGAAPALSVKPLTLITKLSASDQSYGMVVKGKVIYLFGNVTGVVSTDGYLQALGSTGLVQWSLALDSGQNEIATAATVDANGNIWVLGSTSTPSATPSASPTLTAPTTPAVTPAPTDSPTPTVTATPTPTSTSTATSVATSTPTPTSVASTLNPDSVQVDTSSPLRKELTKIILWKVSRAGVLLATYTLDMKRPVLVRSVISIKSGVTNGIAFAGIISTTTGTAGFYGTSDLNGVFSKPINLGKTDTEINALMKMSSGSVGISGGSSETLSGTKLSGIRDGIISSIPLSGSSAGKIGRVIRSFNTKSARSWQSATNSLFLGGDAVTSGKMEAVVTKFSSTFSPSWTVRYPSSSPAMTADGVTSYFALFSSTSLISGIKGWKPVKGSSLTLAFTAKGALIGAYSLAGVPISIGFSQDLGLVVLGRGTLGVSIFHTLTR